MEQVDIQQQQLVPDRGVLIKTRTLCPLFSLILLLQIQSRAWLLALLIGFMERKHLFIYLIFLNLTAL